MLSRDEPIVKDPQILGGTAVFRGTRVPIQALFDYREAVNLSRSFSQDFPLSRVTKR